MKRTLNTTIDRSKNEKNDEFYTQYTLIFSLCGAAPLRETTPSYDIDDNRISGDLQGTGVGGLLYLTVNDSVYIPFYDNNGNITRYLDSTDETVATYTYDAFGNSISHPVPSPISSAIASQPNTSIRKPTSTITATASTTPPSCAGSTAIQSKRKAV